MRVLLAARAKRELMRLDRVWRESRPAAPGLLIEELEAAKLHLLTAPQSGELLGERQERPLRRWLLPKTQYHLYFSVDLAAEMLIIHSIWGARRRNGPKL